MSPFLLVWVGIFLVRALDARRSQPTPGPTREDVDLPMLLVLAAQVGIAVVILTLVGWGWMQLVLALWAVGVFPQWAAWRICQPRALRRLGFVLIASTPRRASAREGRRRLFDWSLGGGEAGGAPDLPPMLRPYTADTALVEADGWTTCAAALKAEAVGDTMQADRLSRGLADLPDKPRLPRLVSRIGFDLLAFAALRRRDWPAVLQRASLGRGRGCRFLRLLARAHVKGDVPAPWLWLAWSMAPRRRRMLSEVRDALAPSSDATPLGDRFQARTPWGFHLRALKRAVADEPIERRYVLRLARLWDGPLGGEARARLRARALELGVADPEAAARAIYAGVLEDLNALASVAVGPWPTAGGEGNVSTDMVREAENRLFADLEQWIEPYRSGGETEIGYPLAEWDRWLAFREGIDRVEEALGETALTTCWHGGVRLAAWNWPCRLLSLHEQRAAWVCHLMFLWTARMAERMGDAEAATVNLKNATVALGMVVR
jgi:hypothetical protein